jgi:hypothetical protein
VAGKVREKCLRKNTGFYEVSAATLFHPIPGVNISGLPFMNAVFLEEDTQNENRPEPARKTSTVQR